MRLALTSDPTQRTRLHLIKLCFHRLTFCQYALPTSSAFHIQHAHYGNLRTLDFNPLKQYCMVTGGDDGALRFWDIRNPTRPLASISHHTHW